MDRDALTNSGFSRQAVPRIQDAMSWFECARKASILVVGDFFLDRYWEIDRRIAEDSIETGLEAHQVVGRRLSPGAAGCGKVMALGFTGADGEGFDLRMAMAERGIDTSFMWEHESSMTPTYTKPMFTEDGDSWRELSRLDIQNRAPLDDRLRRILRAGLVEAWKHADGVIVSDQVEREGCGVWDAGMRELLSELAEKDPRKPVLVDSRANIGRFRSVMLKPNEREAAGMLGLDQLPEDPATMAAALRQKVEQNGGRAWFVTLGACGMVVCENDEEILWLPGIEVDGPIDIVGAGDSTAAGIMTGLVGGASLAEAGWIGQATASLTIQQIGTTGTARPEEVVARLASIA
jgi:bifunctional ADP-heptose synthase (sugar kinase/adenylyltransferase)